MTDHLNELKNEIEKEMNSIKKNDNMNINNTEENMNSNNALQISHIGYYVIFVMFLTDC